MEICKCYQCYQSFDRNSYWHAREVSSKAKSIMLIEKIIDLNRLLMTNPFIDFWYHWLISIDCYQILSID